jgi:membrane associated rhomboid family serine protease
MRDAAVGFQCPECVKDGAKTQRTARTTFGGTARADGGVVTKAILIACIAVFVGQLATGTRLAGGGVPANGLEVRFGMFPGAIAIGHEWYRLITPMFLHAGLLHIAFNMLALMSLGTAVEGLLGRARFLALYLVAGFCGNVASYTLAPVNTLSVGASTALFGLFGAYFVLAKRMRADTSQIAGLIAINLVLTFAIPQIDWRGHVGGLVGGAACAAVIAYAPHGPRQRVLQWAGLATVLAVAVVVAVLRTAAITG